MKKAIKLDNEEFSYCVGKPWNSKNPNSICVYTYHNSIHYGTMEDAKNFLKFVEVREGGKKYNIYKLVKIK